MPKAWLSSRPPGRSPRLVSRYGVAAKSDPATAWETDSAATHAACARSEQVGNDFIGVPPQKRVRWSEGRDEPPTRATRYRCDCPIHSSPARPNLCQEVCQRIISRRHDRSKQIFDTNFSASDAAASAVFSQDFRRFL